MPGWLPRLMRRLRCVAGGAAPQFSLIRPLNQADLTTYGAVAVISLKSSIDTPQLDRAFWELNPAAALDRYGHLMPGSEDEAAKRLDALLVAS